jgi:cytochrome b561
MEYGFGPVFQGPEAIQPSVATTVMARPISWSGMAVPLMACTAIWGIGDAAPKTVAWLAVLHGTVTFAASGWTILRLLLVRRTHSVVPRKHRLLLPPASLMVLYSLLILQPGLAVLASMLHGNPTTLFAIPLPSVLPANQTMAREIDHLHGYNALLLLLLISAHIAASWRELQRIKTPSTSLPPKSRSSIYPDAKVRRRSFVNDAGSAPS